MRRHQVALLLTGVLVLSALPTVLAAVTPIPPDSYQGYAHSTESEGPTLITSLRQQDVQKVAQGIIGVPEIASQIDGNSLKIVIRGDSTWSGTASGGGISMAQGDSGSWAVLTMDKDVFLSLLNSYDMANTAKLILKAGVLGIDGATEVRGAANSLRTGAFDGQLGASPPAAGASITFTDKDGKAWSGTLANSPVHPAQVRLGTRDYIVNKFGALEGQLPDAALKSSVTTFKLTMEFNGISSGVDDHVALRCQATDAASVVTLGHSQGSCARDLITGDRLNDAIFGGSGDDYLQGGLGDDQVRGGAGPDILEG